LKRFKLLERSLGRLNIRYDRECQSIANVLAVEIDIESIREIIVEMMMVEDVIRTGREMDGLL
jgi:hypothetical protein